MNLLELSNVPIGNVLQMILSKWKVGFSCTELLLLSNYPPIVAFSVGTCKPKVRILSEKICEYKV